MKNLKQHWEEFVGDPSEYLPYLLIAVGFVVATYVFGLSFYSHNL
jgi:hypothetical protein